MAKTVTTRLDDESVNKIDEMAAKKGIDRSALLRLFLINALKEQTIQYSIPPPADLRYSTIPSFQAVFKVNASLWWGINAVTQRPDLYLLPV